MIDLAKRYGASVVIGTIDEEGMARGRRQVQDRKARLRTGDERSEPAASDIFFDPLALPISTGIEEDRRNALETIEGDQTDQANCRARSPARRFNVSFGLNPASRVVLNSVFLHDAVEAGLDAAIVNEQDRTAEPHRRKELKVARELIYDERKFEGDVCVYDPLTEFTKLFEGVKSKAAKKRRRVKLSRSV